jgi:hypothetical protein
MEAYNALVSVAALFGLWLVVYYVWRDYRYDSFREDVFSVRDEMFLYAANGNIGFSDPAYALLRNRMNALLRHGHDLTIRRAVLLFVTHGTMKSDAALEWEKAIKDLPAEQKARMEWYNRRVAIYVLQHLVYCSFFRYLVFRPFLTGTTVHQLIATPVVATGVRQLESTTVEEDERLVAQTARA